MTIPAIPRVGGTRAPAPPALPLPPVNALYRTLNAAPSRPQVVFYVQVGRVGVYWPTKAPKAAS